MTRAGDASNAVAICAKKFVQPSVGLALKRTVLTRLARTEVSATALPQLLGHLFSGSFDLARSELKSVISAATNFLVRDFSLAFALGGDSWSLESKQLALDAMCDKMDQTDYEWLNEEAPEAFNQLVLSRPAIAYQPHFWNLKLSLFDKVDLFRKLSDQPGINRGMLFGATFTSRDRELLSKLTDRLSSSEVPTALNWIVGDAEAVTRPEWIAFFASHRYAVIDWLNGLGQYTPQAVILASNVLGIPENTEHALSEEATFGLCEAAAGVWAVRHEVAAFVFAKASQLVPEPAPQLCLSAFLLIHKAIAQSRLSNRAWEIISPFLISIPGEEWDSCEQLRRALLFALFRNGWNELLLWNIVQPDIDLFYDFVHTSRSFDPGKRFFQTIQTADERGQIKIDRKQQKQIRRLFDSWW